MTQADWVKEEDVVYYQKIGAEILRLANKYGIDHVDFASEVSTLTRLSKELAQQRTEKKCLERAKYRLETYVWDGNIGDGLAKDGGHDYLIEVMENRKLLTKAVLSDLLK